MAKKYLDLLKQDVHRWNAWRRGHQNSLLDLSGADLSKANLSRVDFGFTDLSGTNFSFANLSGANLSGANLYGTDLSFADLSSANLSEVNLYEADLSGTNLSSANFSGADLRRTNLRRVIVFGDATDLGGANLSEAHLNEAALGAVNLSEANLSKANLNKTNLSFADLSSANLSEANLSGANLSGANLSAAILNGTTLNRTNFSEVQLWHTVFARIDLLRVKGLDTVIHYGPSSVDVNSVVLPRGKFLKSFLRGTGFSDIFIEYLPALQNTPIQYHSCFISYCSKDSLFAKKLHSDLQDSGVRCWFAPEDMKIGDKIRVRIDEAIHLHEKLLLLLSEYALASTWVEDEVEAALEKERLQQREVLFPVRLDESVMQTSCAWAAKLRRTRHIGDFTRWTDPQAYQQVLERLLRDLKVENAKEGMWMR